MSSSAQAHTAAPAGAGLRFVFDAGTTARLYLPDVSTRNLMAMYTEFSGAIHTPSLILGEITAAWLAGLRAQLITAEEYADLKAAFLDDVRNEVIVVWSDDTLHNAVVDIQERNSSVLGHHVDIQVDPEHAVRLAIPRIETSDAYYVALALVLRDTHPQDRVIFVTNDNAAWTVAYSLGLEVFHGRTCDLGTGRRHIGAPGANFPDGRQCVPCQLDGCPSGFQLVLQVRPPHLGTGIPEQSRQRPVVRNR